MTLYVEIKQDYTQQSEIDKGRQLPLKTRQKMYAYQLELRLRDWGRWIAKSIDNGIGYSARSITVAALEGSRSTAPHYPVDNALAEEVEKAVIHLTVMHPDWSEVLKQEYICFKLDIEKNDHKTLKNLQRTRAKKLNIKFSTYQSYLRLAKIFIEAKITS